MYIGIHIRTYVPIYLRISDTVFSNGCRAPPWRQVYGDICYIKVKPLDGDVFYLTASTEGYYVNKVCAVESSVCTYTYV